MGTPFRSSSSPGRFAEPPDALFVPAMGDHPSDRLTSPPSPGRVVSFALDASESSPNKVTVGEEDGVWDDFLEAYSQGQWNPPPPLPSPAPTISQIDSGPRWFGTIPSSLGSARAALGVYQEKGYFPPIPGRE